MGSYDRPAVSPGNRCIVFEAEEVADLVGDFFWFGRTSSVIQLCQLSLKKDESKGLGSYTG